MATIKQFIWVDVLEHLPNDGEFVLVTVYNRRVPLVARYAADTNLWYPITWRVSNVVPFDDITHWQELPPTEQLAP